MKGIGNYKLFDEKYPNNGKAYRLRTQFGSFINQKWSAGLGIGLDGYHSPDFNTSPIYADAHFYVPEKPWFFFMDLGYSIPWNLFYKQGWMYNLGVGMRNVGKKNRLMVSLGYNIQQIKEHNIVVITQNLFPFGFFGDNDPIFLKTISFSLGFFVFLA